MGWGIAWYINGLMIPEIHVVRGKTYTFVIEGGNDPGQTAAYHPFYITDDPEGGYQYKSKEQRRKVRVFAGIEESRGWPYHGELSPRSQYNSICFYDIPCIGLVLESRARLREFSDVNFNTARISPNLALANSHIPIPH